MTEDEEIKEAESKVVRSIIGFSPLTLLAILTPLSAYFSLFIPINEQESIWFQRSGSITVLFAVWIEYNLSTVNEHINLSGIWTTEQANLSNKYKHVYKIFQYIGVLLAVAGTVIWGYGDVIYKSFAT